MSTFQIFCGFLSTVLKRTQTVEFYSKTVDEKDLVRSGTGPAASSRQIDNIDLLSGLVSESQEEEILPVIQDFVGTSRPRVVQLKSHSATGDRNPSATS